MLIILIISEFHVGNSWGVKEINPFDSGSVRKKEKILTEELGNDS